MDQRTDWPLVWLLWLAGLGAAAQYGKISVVFDRLPEIYPDTGAVLGFAVSLVGALGIILGVVAGVLVARVGYRRALLAALIVGALVSLVQATWPPFPVFLATRLIEGATHLAIVVAAPTLIAEVTAPKDQGRALTLWGSFFGVAFAVLAWGGVALADRYGLGALMAAHGVYLVVMALGLGRRVPSVVRAPQSYDLKEILAAHARIYGSARIGAPAIGWLFYTFCFVSTLTVLPPFVPEAWRAVTLTAMPLLSIVVSLTLGVWLLRHVSAVTVVVLGFFCCAASALALWFVPGAPWAAMALGGALGLVQGATFASVAQLNDATADRALANGGLAQMGNLGNTSGTPVMLAVIAGFAYSGLVLGMVMLFLVGAAAHILLARRRER